MDENHQDKTGSKLITSEDKIWLPSLSPKDQEKLDHLHRNPKKAIIKGIGFSDKTLWDWLQLLIIPFVLAIGGFWFSAQQNQISLQVSQRQHDTDLQIAADQQKEDILVNYQKDISDLLLNSRLASSTEGNPVQEVARMKTLTALRRLDPLRKGFLIQFLYEARLIIGQPPIISLKDADLSGISLGSNIGLNDHPSVYAPPVVGESNHCHLQGINLDYADLKDAYLRNADLSNASLAGTYLGGADLSGANLKGTRVTSEQLYQAKSLKGTTMPNGSKHP